MTAKAKPQATTKAGPTSRPSRPPILDRPLGRGPALALGALLLCLPAWVFADGLGWFYPFDPFGSFFLVLDDGPYLAESRVGSALLRHLFTPHNAHVVPVFRLWMYGLCSINGRLAELPTLLGCASYLTLVSVMISGGRLVARETRSAVAGLAAMLGLGLSTVMEPATTWFSASQATLAGFWTVLALLGLQAWRDRGRTSWLVLALVATVAAPLTWSGGYVAGPVGAAYLGATGRAAPRRLILALILGPAALGLVLVTWASRSVAPAERFEISPRTVAAGFAHSAQAIPEVLILNNLGVDGASDARQGVALSVSLAALWGFSRRGHGPIRPLEAAGATMTVLSFLLVFIFRGRYGYDSLRDLAWYHVLPQIGAVLFAAGWASALFGEGRDGLRIRRRDALPRPGSSLTVALVVLHLPRAQALFMARIPKRTGSERKNYPIPELQRLRGVFLASERAQRQRRALVRLDQAEALARRLGLSKRSIRSVFGPIGLPAWPPGVTTPDALDLLRLPHDGPPMDRSQVARLAPYLLPEPDPRPPWLEQADDWPPPPGRDDGGSDEPQEEPWSLGPAGRRLRRDLVLAGADRSAGPGRSPWSSSSWRLRPGCSRTASPRTACTATTSPTSPPRGRWAGPSRTCSCRTTRTSSRPGGW